MDRTTYISAAIKHLDDAELLLANARWDNAAYLAGYVAECALKSLLLVSPMPAGKMLGHDVALMTDSASWLAFAIAPARRRYSLPTSPAFQELVRNWTPDDRYGRRGVISQTKAASRVQAAREVHLQILVGAILDGESLPQS